jgi:Bacteriophage clamp loader A subunit
MELKDWINSVSYTKENLLESSPSEISDYPPYIINRCLSAHLDCILYVNEMNRYSNLDKDMQYLFYLNSLRKRKRFSLWINKEKLEDLDAVKSYYGYSNEKAKQALKILTQEQLTIIKSKFETGGLNERSRT